MMMSSRTRHRRCPPRSPRSPQSIWGRRLAVAALVLGCSAALSGSWAASRSGDPATTRATTPAPTTQRAESADWVAILARLSDRRSIAWQRSRPGQLDEVFEVGSPALRRDRAALREYRGRGVVVDRARVEFVQVTEVARGADGLVRLDVTDRLAPVLVRDRAGKVRALPRDRLTRHVLWLRLTRSGWRIAAVELAAR